MDKGFKELSNPVTVGGGIFSLLGLSTFIYLKANSDDIPRDLSNMWTLLVNKRHLTDVATRQTWSIVDFWYEALAKNSKRTAYIFLGDDDKPTYYTYQKVEELSNQVANWAISEGIKSGDVVAVMMDNCPEYVITWLGLAKLNAISALINPHLRGQPLKHSLKVCGAKHFIISNEHLRAADEIRTPEDFPDTKWFSFDGIAPNFVHLNTLLVKQDTKLRALPPKRHPSDTLMYIYTSGTTGLPKASVIRHMRYYMAGVAFCKGYKLKDGDVFYNPLPLYHSAGGMIGICGPWVVGGTVVLRRKFSASKFWEDAAKYNCTVTQYIGELCRYLLAQPPKPSDTKHKIRIAIGNGLRSDIWAQFKSRFNIQIIGEFYAATEGNAGIFNTEDKEGAIGFIPPLIQKLFPVRLIKFDVENEEVIRDRKTGFCIPCKPGEIGEAIGLIDQTDPLRQFAGYTDKKASEKKILKDVFEKGDQYFRSGDLLRMDKSGFFYFVDRIGDTFRWKGENVSTSEVEYVCAKVPGVKEVNVFGVAVPNHDGRAGMACMVIDEKSFDWKVFYDGVKSQLPSYAAPLFVRLRKEMETTGTFKHRKVDLVKEGIDPRLVKDPLFIRDDNQKNFVPLTLEKFATLGITAKL